MHLPRLAVARLRHHRANRYGLALAVAAVLAGGHPTPAAPPVAATGLGYRLSAIAFVGARVGYGYFLRPGARDCRAEIGRTYDGGAVFGSLTEVTSWDCDQNAKVSYLATDDHGNGFLYGPDLFVTHDGGRTWAPGTLPGRVLDIEPLATSVWAVTAMCRKPQSLECALHLWVSGDGGRTWSRHRAPARWANPFLAAAGQSWIVRTGPEAAYLLSGPVRSTSGHDSYVPIWATGNGGASWVAHRAPCGIWALSAALSVSPDGTAFMVCASEPGAGFQAKSVLRSTDGGARWETEIACDLAAKPSAGCASALDNGYLGGIVALSSRRVLLFGGRASLMVSGDGGAKWRPAQPTIGDSGASSGPVVRLGNRHALALGADPRHGEEQAIWSTSDGGMHWSSVDPRVGMPSPA